MGRSEYRLNYQKSALYDRYVIYQRPCVGHYMTYGTQNTHAKPRLTGHAIERAGIRLSPDELKEALRVASIEWAKLSARGHRAGAIVALDLKGVRRTDNSGYESNGDMVVLIVVNGSIVTAYLRRSSQPMNAQWREGINRRHNATISKKGVVWGRGTETIKSLNQKACAPRRRRY